MAFPTAELFLVSAPWALVFGLVATLAIQHQKRWGEQEHMHSYIKITEHLYRLSHVLQRYESEHTKSETLFFKIKIIMRDLEEDLQRRHSLIQAQREPEGLGNAKHKLQGLTFQLFKNHGKVLHEAGKDIELRFLKLFLQEKSYPHKTRRIRKLKFP